MRPTPKPGPEHDTGKAFSVFLRRVALTVLIDNASQSGCRQHGRSVSLHSGLEAALREIPQLETFQSNPWPPPSNQVLEIESYRIASHRIAHRRASRLILSRNPRQTLVAHIGQDYETNGVRIKP
jgi:hypothetical protein